MEKQYARFPIEFFLFGSRYQLETLISEKGARRVFDMNSVPKGAGNITGKEISVRVNGIDIPGIFTREILPDSNFYNIRFHFSSPESKIKLQQDISLFGFPSPWRRIYPRIPSLTDMEGIALPTIALVEIQDGVQFYKIINFTLGGLLLEGDLDTTMRMTLGNRFYFQMMVSDNTSISGVWGKVIRIDEEIEDKATILRYGIRIVSMSSLANNRYRSLILDYCEKVKKMYQA